MPYANPHTPAPEETDSPKDFLKRYLAFMIYQNERLLSIHEPYCHAPSHRPLMSDELCCLNATQIRVENISLLLAGCRSGLWTEHFLLHTHLNLAERRLAELKNGHDFYTDWRKVIQSSGSLLYSPFWDESTPEDKRPLMSLPIFKTACRKYGLEPDLLDVAAAFFYTSDEVQEFWAEAE